MLLVAVVGLLVIIVIALLGVIIFRKPSESMGEYLEDSWEDEVEESFGMTINNIRLDYEDDTLWNTVSDMESTTRTLSLLTLNNTTVTETNSRCG